MIFETFWKSLTRLSRLLKVSSRPRLSRLVNTNQNIRKAGDRSIYNLEGKRTTLGENAGGDNDNLEEESWLVLKDGSFQ